MSERRWFGLQAGASNWLWLAVAVIVLDQCTKAVILERLGDSGRHALLPFLELVSVTNPGGAFSLLSDAGGWQRWFFITLGVVVSAGILYWLRRLPAKGQALLAAGLSLIVGGALGNVIDRVLLGHVIDFIRVHYDEYSFPSFNVADSAITIGAALVILDNLLELDRARAKKKS
jgi:signal peptidase II